MQIPANIEIRFTKVRSAKKKKDKAGRRLGRGSNVGENLRRTGDLSLRDTSNFVLWEFSVSFCCPLCYVMLYSFATGRTPTHHSEFWNGQYSRQLLSEKKREGRAYTQGGYRMHLVASLLITPQGDLGEPFVLEPQ